MDKRGKQAKKTVQLFSNINKGMSYDSSEEDYDWVDPLKNHLLLQADYSLIYDQSYPNKSTISKKNDTNLPRLSRKPLSIFAVQLVYYGLPAVNQ